MLEDTKTPECDEIHQEKQRKMGSLPNLHELGKQDDEIGGYKPGPALGHLCDGGCNAILTAEEKARILRTSRFLQNTGHQKIKKATSNPHEYSTKASVCEDEAAELAARKKLKEGYNKEMMERYFRNYTSEYSPTSGSIPQAPTTHFRESFSRRRRDSWNSSGGTSTRRLCLDRISNVLPKPNDPEINQVFTKRQVLRRITFTCICHFLFWCAHGPFLALQSSISVWTTNESSSGVNMKAGSQLVALTYLTAALTSLVAPIFTAMRGAYSVTSCSFSLLPLVYSMHLSSILRPYLPLASIMYGWHLGFISSGHSSHLFVLAHRMTRLFHGGDEDRIQARRTTIVRRFFRAFQAAQDLGLLIGSLITALVITFTLNLQVANVDVNNTTIITEDCQPNTTSCQNSTQPVIVHEVVDYNLILDDIFEKSENSRICGIQTCPINDIPLNTTIGSLRWDNKIVPDITARTLMAIYCFLSVVCFILFLFGDKQCFKMYLCPRISEQIVSGKTLFKSVFMSYRNFSLKLVNAMAFFIGIEQAYIYGDFSKYFVVCTLGVHHLNLAFLSMALLQSIANLTLSMLLRTIRRCYVLMVGFLFHACLLLVLYMWKPAEDDPALFYVISAAWGVCNAIWEMLVLTFLTAKYPENWDAPFAWTFFLKYLAMALMFLLHGTVCGQLKLFILAGSLFGAVSTYLCMDLSEFASKRDMTRL